MSVVFMSLVYLLVTLFLTSVPVSADTVNTGDASAEVEVINIVGEGAVMEDNDVSATANTGGSESKSSATVEVKLDHDGQVSGRAETQAGGTKEEIEIKKTGEYKLEVQDDSSETAAKASVSSKDAQDKSQSQVKIGLVQKVLALVRDFIQKLF